MTTLLTQALRAMLSAVGVRGAQSAHNLTTKRRVAAFSRTFLKQHGWLIHDNWDFREYEHEQATKGPISLLLNYSAPDKGLTRETVGDLNRITLGRGIYPTFIYMGRLEPSALEAVRNGRNILIPASDLEQLDAALQSLIPTITGSIEAIESPNLVSGWVRVSPGGRAKLTAHIDGEIVGECVADIYREDLLQFGDGKYAFRLSLSKAVTAESIKSVLRVDVFVEERYIDVLKY